MMHNLFKFDDEKSTYSITFLDTLIYIDKNRQLQTLPSKPTNTHNYLHYRSSDPKHFRPFPYSQTIRLYRIYTENNELKRQNQNDTLKLQFSAHGYPHTLIENQTTKSPPLGKTL